MKGRLRFVLGVACCALVGLTGGVSTGVLPSVPPEVAELLPHAVVLWEEQIIEGPYGYFDVDLVTVGDFTGDSIPDLIISQHTTLFILGGRADGTFDEVQVGAFFPLEERPLRFRVLAALSDDLNGDGAPDLIVSTIADEKRGAVFIFENQRRRFRPMATYALPSPTNWIALVDVTADGETDLIFPKFDRESGVTRSLALPRIGKFDFGEPITVGEGRGWPLALCDLDGDGFPDLVLLHYDLTLWPDTGYLTVLWGHHAGFHEGSVFKPALGEAVHAAVGDLNGDGRMDLVVATTRGVLAVQVVGREFVEGLAFDPGFLPQKVWLTDMDGDGHVDAILSAPYYRNLTVWAGDGQGRIKGRVAEYVPPLGLVHKLHVGDFDGDGLPDIVLNYSSYLVLLRNGGQPRGSSAIPISGAFLLAVGDLSGNGAPDLLVQLKDGVEVLWNNGKGGLVRAPLIKVETASVAATVGNGLLYTLVQEKRRRHAPPPVYIEAYVTYVLRAYSPLGELLNMWELGEGCFPILSVGDLDGDGKKDLVGASQNQDRGEVWILWSGAELVAYSIAAQGALLAVADFDGDGKDEIAAVCIAEYADLRILSFLGREVRIADPLLQLPAQPMAVTAGDLDGDGIADPVFIAFTVDVEAGPPVKITISGAVLGMWLSARQAAQTWKTSLAQGDLPWPFTGIVVGDYTGDGLGDVVFTSLAATGPVLLPGQGDGTFGEPQVLPVPLGPIFAADLDGNGFLELAGSTQAVNPHLRILWNGGGGQ